MPNKCRTSPESENAYKMTRAAPPRVMRQLAHASLPRHASTEPGRRTRCAHQCKASQHVQHIDTPAIC